MTWTQGGQSFKKTEDGEMWTTVTERENDVYATYAETGIGSTKYICFISLKNAAFPHIIQGQTTSRVDISSLYLSIDASVNTNGIFNLGVVTRIDGTNADIKYFTTIPFLATTTQFSLSLRGTPSQVKTDSTNGVLQHCITNIFENNVAAVNTGIKLDSPLTSNSIIPAVGDIVAKLAHVSGGSYNIWLGAFYHSH